MRSLQNYKTYTNLSVFLNLMTLRTRKILSLDNISWIPRSPFWITEIEGPLLTYDQMSDNDLLSCTHSLVTIMVVINHRNIPWGPRCLHRQKWAAWSSEKLSACHSWYALEAVCLRGHWPVFLGRGSGCGLSVPGLRGVVVVAVALLLGFLLCPGSLPVLPKEGSAH